MFFLLRRLHRPYGAVFDCETSILPLPILSAHLLQHLRQIPALQVEVAASQEEETGLRSCERSGHLHFVSIMKRAFFSFLDDVFSASFISRVPNRLEFDSRFLSYLILQLTNGMMITHDDVPLLNHSSYCYGLAVLFSVPYSYKVHENLNYLSTCR